MKIDSPTVVHRLLDHADTRPDAVLYRFLQRGETETDRMTFAELDRRSRAVGALLQSCSAPGDRALLAYPPGLDFVAAFLGCLYAGVVAVPVQLPSPREGLARMGRVAADCGAGRLLTVAAQVEDLAHQAESVPALAGRGWIATDTVEADAAALWREHLPDPAAVAFLQYTSGSTGDPKGVIVRHANLVANERVIQQAFRHSADTVVVGWLPLHHDMGLIGNVLQPLWLGIPCVLMSPLAFLQRPIRWLKAISDYRATTSGGPNFAYDMCVRRIADEDCRDLDLSAWDLAYNGSETVRQGTLWRFSEKFAPAGFRRESFYPCYGLAECTLFATGGDKGRLPRLHSRDGSASGDRATDPDAAVSCGSAWGDTRVAVVDPETRLRCPAGTEGEVWLGGGSVAAGYWNRPAESAATFAAEILAEPGRAYLRTGDLGVLVDGELFITGRCKEVIVIRGRNFHPQDIERTAEQSDPALAPHAGAAFSVTRDGEERLVVVQEVDRRHLRSIDCAEATAAVTEAIATHHGIAVHEILLVPPGSVPKTTSGKIRRGVCRELYIGGALETLDSVDREERT